MGTPVDHIKSLSKGADKGDEFAFFGFGKIVFLHKDLQELGGPGLCFLPDQQYDGTGGHLSPLHQPCIWPVILRE